MTNVCPNCGHKWEQETTYTRDQIAAMDVEEYDQHRDKILKAMSEGKIQ